MLHWFKTRNSVITVQSKNYAIQYFVCIAFAQSIIHCIVIYQCDSHHIDISVYNLIISRLFPSHSRYNITGL